MTWTEDQARTLRNIKFRSAKAHEALDNKEINHGRNLGAIEHAIHVLATGLEELTSFVESLEIPEIEQPWTAHGVVKAGESELRLEASLTSTSNLVFSYYQANEPYSTVWGTNPTVSLTNGGDLVLVWTEPMAEDVLVSVAHIT
jgi:hypothetical protein